MLNSNAHKKLDMFVLETYVSQMGCGTFSDFLYSEFWCFKSSPVNKARFHLERFQTGLVQLDV